MQPNELLVAPGYDTFSADQLLPGQSEQEGIHACPRTMMASTSPAGGVFGILPAYLAELVRVHLRAGMTWDLATAQRYSWAGRDAAGPTPLATAGPAGMPPVRYIRVNRSNDPVVGGCT